jgi:hypothetical protein
MMKRTKRPEFTAKRWDISVRDGNGELWLRHFPDAPLGPVTRERYDLTPKITDDICRALQQTIDYLKSRPRRGPASIVELPRREAGEK